MNVRFFRAPGRWPALLGALALAGCGSESPTEVEEPVFVVEITGERFRIALVRGGQVDTAEALLESGAESIVYGELAHGDGGFNAPYSWHMVPETVSFPDLTLEACSGRPESDVEADVEYWVDNLGSYCPWAARIVERVH